MVIISIRIGLLISDKTRRGHYTDVTTLYSGRQEDLCSWLVTRRGRASAAAAAYYWEHLIRPPACIKIPCNLIVPESNWSDTHYSAVVNGMEVTMTACWLLRDWLNEDDIMQCSRNSDKMLLFHAMEVIHDN